MLSLPSPLIRPHPPVWIALSDFPCGYTKSPCHSRAILTATQTFPTLATRQCMIATCSTPEDLIGAYPISLPIGTSNHPLTRGLTSPSEVTTLLPHVRFRCGPHTCSPHSLWLLLLSFHQGRSPPPDVRYNYRAKMGIALAGLSPACLIAL